MAAFQKFNLFVDDVLKASHNFSSHTFNVMLTNTAPVATNHLLADLTEIAAGNGYTAGGTATTVGISNTTGTDTVTGTNVVFTATGTIGPFRYAVLYNVTQATPLKPLVGYWDYGSSVTLNSGETFTVAPTGGNLFTLA